MEIATEQRLRASPVVSHNPQSFLVSGPSSSDVMLEFISFGDIFKQEPVEARMAMIEDFETLKAELVELDRQLVRFAANQQMKTREEAVSGRSEHLMLLKQKLNERLSTLDPRGWQLLLLEWRYDFALLFDHIRLWIARVDSCFDMESHGDVREQSRTHL